MTHTLTNAVTSHGVLAVFVLMAVDALLPVGGELVMVVAGALAAGAISASPQLFGHQLGLGVETYLALALGGTIGYVAGSLVGWLLGSWIDRDALARHGRLIHLGPHNLERAEHWFARHGPRAVLLGRLTPVVRSFVSVPAGLFGEPLGRYTALTALGSAIWCFGFAGAGWALGGSYRQADTATHVVEAILLALVLAAGVVLWRRRRLAQQAS